MPPTIAIDQILSPLTTALRAAGLEVGELEPDENGEYAFYSEGPMIHLRDRESDVETWRVDAAKRVTVTGEWVLAGTGVAVESFTDEGEQRIAVLARVGGWELDYFVNVYGVDRARKSGDLPENFDEAACRDAVFAAMGMPAFATWQRTKTAPRPATPQPVREGERHPLFERFEAALARTASPQKIRPLRDGRGWSLSFDGAIVRVFRMDRPTELPRWIESKREERGLRSILATKNGASVVAGSEREVARWLRVVCDGGLELDYFSNSIEIQKAKERGDLPASFEESAWLDALLEGAGVPSLARWSPAA